MFPEFRAAEAWRRRGQAILEQTIRHQFHEDGGSVEQSTFYHHATLGFYLLAGLLGRRFGHSLSGATWVVVERALEFSCRLTMPDGRIPAIGGADDGKSIRFEHLPFWNFRPFLAVGAVLFDRPDFKSVSGKFWEDALWLLGATGLSTFESMPSELPSLARALPHSGYVVARSGWSTKDDYLCFDCGPQAAGLRRDEVPSAAHGHADCLSVIVTLGGEPVLIDAGFFCYNGDPEWEVHFRKTRAHNTALVDSRDQATHIAKMAWSHTFAPSLESWQFASPDMWAQGSHDGFARRPDGVVHHRLVWLRGGGYVLVYDEFVGGGDHEVAVNWQFAPGNGAMDERGGGLLFEDRFEMRWASATVLSASVVCGGASPADGWIAQSLGVRQAAPRLVVSGQMRDGYLSVLTILADQQHTDHRARVEMGLTADGRLPRARVAGRHWSDAVVVTGRRWSAARANDPDLTPVTIRRERSALT